MTRIFRYFFVTILLAITNFGWGQIILPVEIMGAEGTIESRTFDLDETQQSSAYELFLLVNNLGYENKASIRINDGNWLKLNHSSVNLYYQEKARGGMKHGAYSTIRFTVPATGFVVGTNTISFKFNFSDGISSGYRVVKFNLFDGGGNELMPEEMFEEDDPDTWEAPFTDQASIDEGKDLWYNAPLWSNYLHPDSTGFWYDYELKPFQPIRATCSDCHTQDGRDLELFAYSNESIIERAKFHNLTEEEGQKIASYIRSLSSTANKVNRNGRPWNPPYQPGPQLKGKSIDYWHAGAGLDAVLDDDEDMIDYMFPNGVDSASVANYFDSDKMEEWTEVPVAIQFPDWKHWLPMVHPKDAYNGNGFYDETYSNPQWPYNPERAYEYFRTYLEGKAGGPGKRINIAGKNPQDMMNEHQNWRKNYRFYQSQYLSGSSIIVDTDKHWRSELGDALDNLSDGIGLEFASTSMARLMAVKNFEIMQEFEMQDQAPDYLKAEDQPSSRQWFHHTDSKNVFEVPAHITGCVIDDCQEFLGQGEATGQFESTVWYQLQLVLAAGNGNQSHNGPVDYNYQPEFILRAGLNSDILEPMRYYFSLNHLYQTKTWSGDTNPNNADGFRIRVQGPWYFFGKEADAGKSQLQGYDPGFWPTLLDRTKPGLTKWVLDAQIRQFLKEVQKPQNAISGWTRYDVGGNKAQNLDPESKTESEILDVTEGFSSSVPIYADHMYWVIPLAQDFGVDCDLIEQMIDWSQEAWPLINWDKFRNNSVANLELTLTENCDTGGFDVMALAENKGSGKLEWFVNDKKRPGGDVRFEGGNLVPGDVVRCELSANSSCITNDFVFQEIVIPALDFTVESRHNSGEWKQEENFVVCIDDNIEVKVNVDIEPVLWLDAMDVYEGNEPTDGEMVMAWKDHSSNEKTVSAPSGDLSPQYDKWGMNGLPALMFGNDNSADGMELFTTSEDDFMEEDWTMVIVGQQYPSATSGELVGNNTDGGDGWYHSFSSDGEPQIVTGGTEVYSGSANDEIPVSFISVLQYENGQLSLYVNGELQAQSTTGSTPMTNDFSVYLGQTSNGSSSTLEFHQGPIAEVLVFDYSLSDDKLAYLEGYLSHKWKLEDELSNFHTYKDFSPLDVSVIGPAGQEIKMDGKNTVQSIHVLSSSDIGDYEFYKPTCSEPVFVMSVVQEEDVDAITSPVLYSIDDQAFQSGDKVTVNEKKRLEFKSNVATSGDFQWERPDGSRLDFNMDVELESVAETHEGIWLLHLTDQGCSSGDVQIQFEVEVLPPKQLLIEVLISGSGTIDVLDENYVNEGGDFTVNFIPDDGYKVGEVIVDGRSEGAISSYTISDVIEDHRIEVTFEPLATFSVTVSIGENGTSSVASGAHTVTEGDTFEITFTPNTGYIVEDVFVDGISVGAVSSYTLTATKNHVIVVTFTLEHAILNAQAVEKTTIYPNPFTDRIYLSADRGISRISIVGVDGRQWFEHQNYHLKALSIDLSHVPSGIYVLTVYYQDKTSELFNIVHN